MFFLLAWHSAGNVLSPKRSYISHSIMSFCFHPCHLGHWHSPASSSGVTLVELDAKLSPKYLF